MRILLIAFAALAASSLTATPVTQPAASPKQVPLQNPGFLPVPNTQKGRIALVNKQSRMSAQDIAEIAALIAKDTRCRCEVGAAEGANITVEIIDSPDAPAIAAYPEDFKSTMNVARMEKGLKGGAVAKFFPKRCRKELLRAFCFACGTAGTQYPDNILAIGKISDLDLVGEFIPGDTIYAMQTRLNKIGVAPVQYVSYARACVEGWAPAPTNDVQRMIWDKVHAAPTAPIVIKPESTKRK